MTILRDANWLGPDRAHAWSRVLAILLFIRVAVWIIHPQGGDPIAYDYICYWAAAGLAAAGHAALAYDPAALSRAEHAAIAMDPNGFFGFYYPPSYLLLLLPLAFLPYVISLLTFLAAGLVPFVATVRVLLPQRWAWLPILSFPGVVVTAGTGQNGFLSAACFGGGLVFLDSRPILAGACLGLLSYKPHLALCVPVALFAARRWHSVLGAALSSLGLAALSWLVLGRSAWAGFIAGLPLASQMLAHGLIDPTKLQSTFGAFRILHLSITAGSAVQALVSLSALLMLGVITWRRPGGQAEGATLAAAALVCSPYLVDYDLAVLGLPLAWVMAMASRDGFLPWEKLILLAGYMLPILSHGLAASFDTPVAPVVLYGVFLVVARRAFQPSAFFFEKKNQKTSENFGPA